jgi:aspartyl-tRNA(Asn)/glutamyl-tRNA(Gln) amidotransferase subunit A
VVAYANSLDTVGVLANSPHDIEKVFRAVSAFDSNDPTSMTPTTRQRIACLPRDFNDLGRPLRVGIPAEYNIKELSATIRNAWNEWATKLRQEGVEIVPVSLPNTKYALSAYYVLAPAEASSNLARYDGVRFGDRGLGSDAADGTLYAKRRGELLGEEVKKRILLGTYTLSSEAMDNYFIRAQKVRKLVQRDFDRVFTQSNVLHDEKAVNQKHGVDILLCPTAPTLAPKLADLQGIPSVHAYMTDVFTVPASLAGLPAISMPYQRTDGPENNISMQIIGQYGTDDLVLNIAAKLQHSLVKDARVDQLEPVRPDQDLAEQKHDGFSPELAHKYMQMRRVYGDDMSAVQWNPAKNK